MTNLSFLMALPKDAHERLFDVQHILETGMAMQHIFRRICRKKDELYEML